MGLFKSDSEYVEESQLDSLKVKKGEEMLFQPDKLSNGDRNKLRCCSEDYRNFKKAFPSLWTGLKFEKGKYLYELVCRDTGDEQLYALGKAAHDYAYRYGQNFEERPDVKELLSSITASSVRYLNRVYFSSAPLEEDIAGFFLRYCVDGFIPDGSDRLRVGFRFPVLLCLESVDRIIREGKIKQKVALGVILRGIIDGTYID